jgi:ABC-type glycerol-3-phosphate transport system permease component
MAKTLKKNKPLVAKNNRPFTSPIASAIVSVIAILWTIPTFGLVVTSFRDKEALHLPIHHLLSQTSAKFSSLAAVLWGLKE